MSGFAQVNLAAFHICLGGLIIQPLSALLSNWLGPLFKVITTENF